MKKKGLNILLAGLAVLAVACNSGNNNSTASSDSLATGTTTTAANLDDDLIEFVNEAANGSLMEIELGKIAQQQAVEPRVKKFGAMMVTDHTKASEELKAIASAKGISLPASLPAEHQKHLDEISKKTGVDFDKAYIKMMLKAHRDDIDEFDDVSKDGKDAELKAFAAKTLPVLKMHLDSAKSINKQVKGSLDPNDLSDGVETFPQR